MPWPSACARSCPEGATLCRHANNSSILAETSPEMVVQRYLDLYNEVRGRT